MINDITNDKMISFYIYDNENGDFGIIYSLISCINWAQLLRDTKNVDRTLAIFYHELLSRIEQAIPRKQLNNLKPKYPKYFSRDLIWKIRKKSQLIDKLRRVKLV